MTHASALIVVAVAAPSPLINVSEVVAVAADKLFQRLASACLAVSSPAPGAVAATAAGVAAAA